MWMLTRALLAIALLVTFSVLLSTLAWLFFGDGLHTLRLWWRTRKAQQALQRAEAIRKEWNPRSSAMRGEFGDQITRRQRMRNIVQR